MIVGEPGLRHRSGTLTLGAEVVSESGAFRRRQLSVEVDERYRDWLDRSANPFVPAATLLAVAAGEDVRFEAPVSAKLAHGAEEATGLYSEWWGFRPAQVVAAAGTSRALEPGPGTGLFYSGGFDSTATLLRSRSGAIPERVTHLVSVENLNPHYSRRTERRLWRRTLAAAEDYGLELIGIRTNTPEVLREQIGWTKAFGAVLAGAALTLGPLLQRQLFGCTVEDAHPRARGSHPQLDPLWSTERTSFRQDATETSKLERAALVASDPRALRHLKVCWTADTAGNCGRCYKCLRAMTNLEVGPARGWEATFEAPLTPGSILAMDLKRGQLAKVRKQILPATAGTHPALHDAWAARAREVEEDGPRRPWPRRARRELRRRRRRAVRRTRRTWRRTRRRAAVAFGRG